MRHLVLLGVIVAGVAHADPAVVADADPAAAAVELGHATYRRFCAQCHGPDMVNPGTSSYDLRKFPHDAHERFVTSVTNGKNQQMPAWGGTLSPDEMEAVWAYVRSYQRS